MSFVAWSLYAAFGMLLTIATLSFLTTSTGSVLSIGFLNAAQVTVGLLLLSTNAVTSLAEERATGSLDVLLCTPLSTRTILAGKWWGAFQQGRQVLAWPALATGLLAVKSGHWFAYFTFLGLILAYCAVIASVGLALATWVSRLGRAVALCIGAYVVISIGWVLLTIILFTPDPLGRYVMMGTPAYGTLLATGVVGPEPIAIPGDQTAGLFATVFWTLFDFGLAATLFSATLASFDRCLGRSAKPVTLVVSRSGRSAVVGRIGADLSR